MNSDLSIAMIYKIFARKSEVIFQFVALQNEYINSPREYDTEGLISTSELTILRSIQENPGITTTELAVMHRKTKAALSQTVKKLEQRALVFRKRCPIDGKRALLHVSAEGEAINDAHRQHSLNHLRSTLDGLLEHASVEEVDAFFKVMELYNGILNQQIRDGENAAMVAPEEEHNEG